MALTGVENLARLPELKKKLLWTFLLVAVYRIGVHVPVPGVDSAALADFFESAKNTLFGLFDMFSGGGLRNLSIFALGIMPYISASIIIQLLTVVSPELAKMRGIKNGEKVMLDSTRGSLWAKAIVTERIQPFTVLGQTIHQVGIPWHYGWTWPKNGGDSANILCPSVGDPNTGIPETKAFMVNVRKA